MSAQDATELGNIAVQWFMLMIFVPVVAGAAAGLLTFCVMKQLQRGRP